MRYVLLHILDNSYIVFRQQLLTPDFNTGKTWCQPNLQLLPHLTVTTLFAIPVSSWRMDFEELS
jgi:hypothetical protein